MIRKLCSLTLASLFCVQASATVVEIRTSFGDIRVNLFDETTPETVANFLDYVNSGAYANNVVHRLEPGFVMQAGGFQYNGVLPLDNVPAGVPVVNEPLLSNVRGTIAMAKLSGDPDSATSQWFINLADNSENLDVQNGGFTVFGQVLGEGMTIVDQIAELDRFNLGAPANAIPLINYTSADADAGVDPTGDNLVIIADVVVTDAATVTNPDLVPIENTLLNNGGSGSSNPPPPANNPPPSDTGSGSASGGTSGGALSPSALFGGLFLLCLGRLRRQKSSRAEHTR